MDIIICSRCCLAIGSNMIVRICYCHAELVSASVRGEEQVKARGEILKFAIKREQSQACLGYAEREQFGRSQNGKLNTTGC